MSIELITLLLFGSMIVALAIGTPMAFALGAVGVLFTIFLWSPESLYIIASNSFRTLTNFIMVALPLFIFMGVMLGKSGIADGLYELMYLWMGKLKGGLAIGTVLICTLFAAMAGISGASTVTMGVVALPSMLKRGYDKEIAIGCISAGGALGVLIPPSVIMILYGLYAEVSVGRLFAGGVFPGLVLSALFCTYIGIRCIIQPNLGPPVPSEAGVNLRRKLIALKAVILPILLVIVVLGSIFTGIATPTEASAVGAFGSVLCAAIYRRLTRKNLVESCWQCLKLTCMCMWIQLGVGMFTSVYQGVGASDLISNFMTTLPVAPIVILIGIQLTFLVLGCFLDPVGIILICTPVFVPVIRTLGFDPVWFGVLFVVNMEMAYLTPPFGTNLFYMRGVCPPDITMVDIYRSIVPFVVLQALGLVLIVLFPQIVLWLPNLWLGE